MNATNDSLDVPTPRHPAVGFSRPWIAAAAVIAVAVAAITVVRLLPTEILDYDVKNVVSLSVLAGALLILSSLALDLTSLSRRGKWTVRIVGWLMLGAAALAFRMEEFSGDMTFRLVPRWRAKRDATLAAPALSAATLPAIDLAATTEFDYPQFLGPKRSGGVDNVRLARDWESHPPREVWRKPVGAGWSAFVIVGDHAVTQEQRGDEELVTCYELRTGNLVWSHADPVRFSSVMGGDGPRATPAIDEGKVYAQGATGILNCLDGRAGEKIWSRNIIAENGAEQISWGRSGSPLVAGDLVIVSAGGKQGKSLIAYDKKKGDVRWSAGDDRASYASPALAHIAGVPQVLSVNEATITGHSLDDGRILWQHPWPGSSDSSANASQPVPLAGDRVLLSKGYGVGAELIALGRDASGTFAASEVWKSSAVLKTKMTNVVVREENAYGLSGGILECVNLADGKRQWRGGRYGHGQVILVGDLLLITTEDGSVVLVETTPEAFNELGKFTAFQGKNWNNPAIAGKYLLLRNHEEAACYELELE